MNYDGSQTLEHPLERVWDALLDPRVLRESIAGCESFDRIGESEFACKVKVSIGPVAARFVSQMQITDMVAPSALTLNFSGQGGVAGFGKGHARVTLSEPAQGRTCIEWKAQAQVGGKLAQIGSRLIEASLRKMSEDFFQRFAVQLAASDASAPAAAPEEPVLAQAAQRRSALRRWEVAVGLAALATAAMFWIRG
jgi:carbon monoxide dehydrogenase subunit G